MCCYLSGHYANRHWQPGLEALTARTDVIGKCGVVHRAGKVSGVVGDGADYAVRNITTGKRRIGGDRYSALSSARVVGNFPQSNATEGLSRGTVVYYYISRCAVIDSSRVVGQFADSTSSGKGRGGYKCASGSDGDLCEFHVRPSNGVVDYRNHYKG